jgi:hypothetical protein
MLDRRRLSRKLRLVKRIILFVFLLVISSQLSSQVVYQTFKDTRVINSHSVETLPKRHLDFRIAHRFGDIAGEAGGWPTFYGLETAADVLIGFEYGITDNLMIGISRTKGAGPLNQNINSLIKYRVMTQEKGRNPFSLALVGVGSYSTMSACGTPGLLCFFAKRAHRISYNAQVLAASKINQRLALQFSLGLTYRNNVEFQDQNDLPNAGIVVKYQFTKVFGIIIDATYVFSEFRRETLAADGTREFSNPLGIGFEWETGGGHVFQINLTNSKGLIETDYIPYTTSSWTDGGFRLGFTISRQFKL